MARAYAFVDGAAFENGAACLLKDLGCSFEEINWSALTRKADRIFYFDSLPTKKDDEDQTEFDEKLRKKQKRFALLRRVPNMHVREGFTRIRADNTRRPLLTQKGVDIALAVEVLLHAHLGNIEVARLFLNDLDFFPLLESLTNTRVRTELFYSPEKTADELLEAADTTEKITYYSLFTSVPAKLEACLALSREGYRYPGDAVSEREGTNEFGSVTLWFSTNNKKYYIEGHFEGGQYDCSCRSKKLLISYFETVTLTKIVWAPTESAVAMEQTR